MAENKELYKALEEMDGMFQHRTNNASLARELRRLHGLKPETVRSLTSTLKYASDAGFPSWGFTGALLTGIRTANHPLRLEELERIAPIAEATAKAKINPDLVTNSLIQAARFQDLDAGRIDRFAPFLKLCIKHRRDPEKLTSAISDFLFNAGLSSAYPKRLFDSFTPELLEHVRSHAKEYPPDELTKHAMLAHIHEVPLKHIIEAQDEFIKRGHFPVADLVKRYSEYADLPPADLARVVPPVKDLTEHSLRVHYLTKLNDRHGNKAFEFFNGLEGVTPDTLRDYLSAFDKHDASRKTDFPQMLTQSIMTSGLSLDGVRLLGRHLREYADEGGDPENLYLALFPGLESGALDKTHIGPVLSSVRRRLKELTQKSHQDICTALACGLRAKTIGPDTIGPSIPIINNQMGRIKKVYPEGPYTMSHMIRYGGYAPEELPGLMDHVLTSADRVKKAGRSTDFIGHLPWLMGAAKDKKLIPAFLEHLADNVGEEDPVSLIEAAVETHRKTKLPLRDIMAYQKRFLAHGHFPSPGAVERFHGLPKHKR